MERRDNDSEPGVGTRRPYEAPRVTFREPLEAVAAFCNPVPPVTDPPTPAGKQAGQFGCAISFS